MKSISGVTKAYGNKSSRRRGARPPRRLSAVDGNVSARVLMLIDTSYVFRAAYWADRELAVAAIAFIAASTVIEPVAAA